MTDGAIIKIKAWLKRETEGMFMGKKESNIRPEGAVKPSWGKPGVTSFGPPRSGHTPNIPKTPDIPPKAVGTRDDGGKLKWHLMPVPALLALIKVFHGGAIKYADDQWRLGMKFSRIYRSMISHFMKWLASNSSYDKELGTHHLMMVAWGCFVLYMYEVVYKFVDYDDRPEKGLLTDEDFEFISEMIEVKKGLSDATLAELQAHFRAKHTGLGPLDKDDAAREEQLRKTFYGK